MTGVNFQLQSEYGYVGLVTIVSFVVLNYLGMKVMGARKKYGVEYPKLYSETSMTFNCYQRAHQNTLENFPLFIVFLLLGGLQLPKVSAIFGLIYLAGRVVYAHGYYTGDPSKRQRGVFGYIGLFGLIINTVIFSLNLLGVI